MKRIVFAWIASLAAMMAVSCNNEDNTSEQPQPSDGTIVSVPSPQPNEQITKVDLSAVEKGYAEAGNRFAFNLFHTLAKGENGSFVFSSLSLQYALAMAANGASGQTLQEIIDVLGYGDDGIDALNAYCRKLLEQLPAVDLGVKLSLADALLVNERTPLDADFAEKVRNTYYAVVQNMSFADPAAVADAVNGWASENTNGLIDKMLEPDQIDPWAIAYLMNALYFKAQWVGGDENPLFYKESTYSAPFYPGGCDVIEIPTMHTEKKLRFADCDGFRVLEIPYAGGKFAMYILLPDDEEVGDPAPDAQPDLYTFDNLCQDLPGIDWSAVVASMKSRQVRLSLPKFETASSFFLNDALQKLGVNQAFIGGFDRMFAPRGNDPIDACISKVIQKAKVAVQEWGTEAAAVTVMEMKENSIAPGGDEIVKFYCDHSFIWLIAEKTSGVILFEGAFRGI